MYQTKLESTAREMDINECWHESESDNCEPDLPLHISDSNRSKSDIFVTSSESSSSESSSGESSSGESSRAETPAGHPWESPVSTTKSSEPPRLKASQVQWPVRMTGHLAPRLVNGVLIPRGKPRLKPGTRSLREIRKIQGTFSNLIPRSAFKRLIGTCCREMGVDNKFRSDALEALQEASEAMLVNVFNVANKLAIHAKRVTIKKCDLHLAIEIIANDWDKPSTNDGFCA